MGKTLMIIASISSIVSLSTAYLPQPNQYGFSMTSKVVPDSDGQSQVIFGNSDGFNGFNGNTFQAPQNNMPAGSIRSAVLPDQGFLLSGNLKPVGGLLNKQGLIPNNADTRNNNNRQPMRINNGALPSIIQGSNPSINVDSLNSGPMSAQKLNPNMSTNELAANILERANEVNKPLFRNPGSMAQQQNDFSANLLSALNANNQQSMSSFGANGMPKPTECPTNSTTMPSNSTSLPTKMPANRTSMPTKMPANSSLALKNRTLMPSNSTLLPKNTTAIPKSSNGTAPTVKPQQSSSGVAATSKPQSSSGIAATSTPQSSSGVAATTKPQTSTPTIKPESASSQPESSPTTKPVASSAPKTSNDPSPTKPATRGASDSTKPSSGGQTINGIHFQTRIPGTKAQSA